jgi:hypothetical protein
MSHIPSRRLGSAMTLAGGVAVASLAFAALPPTSGAAASARSTTTIGSQSAPAAAAAYLVGQFAGKHHDHYTSSYTYQGKSYSYVNYGETADAVLSIDAAGVAQSAAKRATSYLEKQVKAYAGTSAAGYSPGAIGKLMLLAEAQHVGVRHFGGVNLVSEVVSTEGAGDASTGEYQQNPVGTPAADDYFSTTSQALAMLGLANSPHAGAQPDAAAVSFLAAQQCSGGGYPSQLLSDPTTACQAGSDIDSTGYAVQALLASGDHAAADKGVAYLEGIQHKNGGFGTGGGNANSTAIAAEALLAAHEPLGGAIGWLQSHQVGCSGKPARRGAVNYQKGYDAQASLLATSQAGAALARRPLAWIDRSGARTKTPVISCSKG